MADGLLAKLTIIPFENSENVQFGPPAGPPFMAQFNPESFTLNNEFEYAADDQAHGDSGSEAKFKAVKPRTFSFEFLLDGTGASGLKVDVLAQINLFKLTVGFLGKIHRPHFLVLNWGTFIATSVLESFSVNYKLFNPNGHPLRAVLSTTFREHIPKALNGLIKNLSSPDITHSHEVKQGEHLSFITHGIYKDPQYYYHVAEMNELNNLRVVEAGRALHFPPLK